MRSIRVGHTFKTTSWIWSSDQISSDDEYRADPMPTSLASLLFRRSQDTIVVEFMLAKHLGQNIWDTWGKTFGTHGAKHFTNYSIS